MFMNTHLKQLFMLAFALFAKNLLFSVGVIDSLIECSVASDRVVSFSSEASGHREQMCRQHTSVNDGHLIGRNE